MLTGIQSLMSDPRVWGSLLLCLLTWFLSSATGHTVILSALAGFDSFVSKRLPANQAAALEHIAAEAVQVAFVYGERLNTDNAGRLAHAQEYLAARAQQAGIDVSKFRGDWLEAIIELAWHNQKAAVLDQAAANQQASQEYAGVLTAPEALDGTGEASEASEASDVADVADLPTVQIAAQPPSASVSLPASATVSYTTDVAPVPAGSAQGS